MRINDNKVSIRKTIALKKLHALSSLIRFVFVLLYLSGNFLSLKAQKKNEQFQIHIGKTSSAIKVDGIMNEETWKNAEVAKNFFMVLPMDTGSARAVTEVRMAYDDHNLYLIAECFQAVRGPNYVESLRNDWSFGKNDNFLLFMDPFDDQTNGFAFGTNSAGAQWDGMMYGGGSVDLNWDNKWVSAVKDYGNKWILEFAVPFKSIRYKRVLPGGVLTLAART